MLNKILNLFVFKIVAAIFGLVYSFLLVYYFGKSRQIEIFFVSSSLLYLITSLTQSGQLSEIFLPEYARLKLHYNKQVADKAFCVVINRLLCWMSGIVIVFFFTSRFWAQVMAPGFTTEEQKELSVMFQFMLIQFVLTIINSFITTVLNAERVYGKAEIAGLMNSLLNVIFLVVLYNYWHVWTLIYSLLFGRVIELFLSIRLLVRTNFRYSFTFKVEQFDHRKFFSVIKSTFVYVGATQIFFVIFTSAATLLAPGVYAIFSHVRNITGKIQGILLGPISVVFFSEFAIKANQKKEDVSSSHLFFDNMLERTLIMMFCFISIVGPLALPIMQTLLYNKHLAPSDIYYASVLFIVFLISMIFNSIGSLFRKALISRGFSGQIYGIWTIVQLVSCVFAYFLLTIYKETGLYIVNPLNIFLLNVVSVGLYFKTQEHRITLNWFFLLKLLVVSMCTMMFLYIALMYIGPFLNQWLVLLVLVPLGCLLLAILLRFTNIMNPFKIVSRLVKREV